jgi:hypothetical protein
MESIGEQRINRLWLTAIVYGFICGAIMWFIYWVTAGIFISDIWNFLLLPVTLIIASIVIYFLLKQQARKRARACRWYNH